MVEVSVKEMMEAGAHFGHQTHRWDPRMKPYIFGARNGIHIIDLQKTAHALREACQFVERVVAEGGNLLFVGTKKQAQPIIEGEAKKVGMFYVNERWLGGTLTNFRTIRSSIERLKTLEKRRDEGGLEGLTKKEKLGVEREITKLTKAFGGIKEMNELPAAVFILDPHREVIARKEANRLKIPVIAVADTNCNPEGVDALIPGNDDAIKAILLFTSKIGGACLEGLNRRSGELRRFETAAAPLPKEVTGEKGKAFVFRPEAYEEKVEGEYTGEKASAEALKEKEEKEKGK